MLLDSPAFQPQLTPEIALGMAQKMLAGKRQREYEVQEIRLVYTPYYFFSFDVAAQQVISGRTSMNAFTGDLSDFAPILLDKPLQKSKQVNSGEVEPTSVSTSDFKDAAAMKIAAHTGAKREAVSVSAVTKYYVPFYRIWVSIPRLDVFKIDVDACLGAPFGMEAIPAKEKTWDEVTNETVNKMKTPSGWAELGGKTIGAVAGAASGKTPSAIPGGKTGGYVLMGLVILFLAWLFLSRSNVQINCVVNDDYLGDKPFLELFGDAPIVPVKAANHTLVVKGICSFKNTGKTPETVIVTPMIVRDDKREFRATESLLLNNLPPVASDGPATEKEFVVSIADDGLDHSYALQVNKVK
jgi:hypothetical protein